MADIQSARAFIEEAITALAVDTWRSPAGSDLIEWTKVSPIEANIAEELDRIDRALGVKGASMFAPIADQIRQAMIALHGAKEALKP